MTNRTKVLLALLALAGLAYAARLVAEDENLGFGPEDDYTEDGDEDDHSESDSDYLKGNRP